MNQGGINVIKLGDVKGVDLPVREVERVLVAGDTGGKPALRGFTTMVDLGDGEFLVGYSLARDHHATPPMGFMTTRSLDEGKTWGESFALGAFPGFNVTGCLGLMRCPDGSIMCNLAKTYYPAWRQYQSVSLSEPHVVATMKPFGEVGPRRFDHFVVRSWDKGYNWTPLDYPLDLFPIGEWSTHATGNSGPYELSDGRWMWSVEGLIRDDSRRVGGVTYSSDKGFTWSPVKLIFDVPYASAGEQRIMKLDERRFLSYTRMDPLVKGERWEYGRNVVHFSLSEDEGETWSEPWMGNFVGSGSPELHRLNDGSFIIIYRDMDPDRYGVNVSYSQDEGRTWRFAGQLCGPAVGTTRLPGYELGYPVSLRVSSGHIFVVYYGPWSNGNADVVGVYLEDLS